MALIDGNPSVILENVVKLIQQKVDENQSALVEKFATLFYGNMSERAATILKDDIEIMGPVRLREVDQAQQNIVNVAKRLAEDGEIYLSKFTDDEVIY